MDVYIEYINNLVIEAGIEPAYIIHFKDYTLPNYSIKLFYRRRVFLLMELACINMHQYISITYQ